MQAVLESHQVDQQ